MPNEETLNDIRDFALGYLLIDLAKVNLRDTGAPVDDEELAIFMEPNGREVLGKKRCEQMLAQLCQDPVLYQRWLMLSHSRAVLGEFVEAAAPAAAVAPPARTQTAARSSTAGWSDWLAGLFAPRMSFAAALGVMAVAVMATYIAVHQSQPQPPMMVMQGDVLPDKASQAVVGVATGIESAADRISKALQCLPLGEDATLCYSATRSLQNWFVMRAGVTLAIPAPVQARKLVSVRTQDDKMLIEYSTDGQFHLSLQQFNLDGQGWSTQVVYADALAQGHFEQLELGKDGLRYNRVTSDNQVEARHYDFGSQGN